jgi:hypothetical protein
MARVAGSYTTQRDGGLTYTYEATWHETGDGIVWSAKVRRSGESAGAPSGQIRKTVSTPVEAEVRRVVETAIETRASVKG